MTAAPPASAARCPRASPPLPPCGPLDVEPDDLLEDDLAEPCRCKHLVSDHDSSSGCRAGACACGALCLEDLAGDDLEDAELEADVTRVTAALRAVSVRRKILDDERRDRAAKEPASLPRSDRLKMVKRKPASGPKVATTKPKAPVLPPPADEDGRIHGLLSVEEDALEAIGAL